MILPGMFNASLAISPHQPATALFRAVELSHLVESGLLPTSGRGLDLGCGDGTVTGLILHKAGLNWSLVGVDPDPEETALASMQGFYQTVHTSGGEAIPETDSSFDFVFSNSVMEHIPNLEPVLHEVARVLKPEGKFIFTVPSEFFHEFLAGPGLAGRIATGLIARPSYLQSMDQRLAHCRYWNPSTWIGKLHEFGLQVEHSSYYLSRTELRRWELLSNLTAGLSARLFRKRPIEIQRMLGARKGRPPLWIRTFGTLMGTLGTSFLAQENPGRSSAQQGACLLVMANKLH